MSIVYLWKWRSISLTNKRKSTGPRNAPWGTMRTSTEKSFYFRGKRGLRINRSVKTAWHKALYGPLWKIPLQCQIAVWVELHVNLTFTLSFVLCTNCECNGRFPNWMQWSPVNTDIKGTCNGVRIIRVSVKSLKAGKEEEGQEQWPQQKPKEVKLV